MSNTLAADATLSALWAALDATPDDADLLLVIADRLEEMGCDGAAMRWAARKGKRPWWTKYGRSCRWYFQEPDRPIDRDDLPELLHYYLAASWSGMSEASKWFDSLTAAWFALLTAWPKAIEKGWQPD